MRLRTEKQHLCGWRGPEWLHSRRLCATCRGDWPQLVGAPRNPAQHPCPECCRHEHAKREPHDFRPDHTVAIPMWCPECGFEGFAYAGMWNVDEAREAGLIP